MKLFTPAGTLIADGYVRVVIGGRGPYSVEALEGPSMNRTLCIQVELAVGWPDHSWTDGHYIYVPETAGDAVSAAIEKLTEEFNTAGTECAFITSYSVEEEQRFTEDGERVEGISAEAHSDDRACEVFFDATVYFVQASDEDLAKLAACGRGGDYPADEVAQFMAGRNKQLAELFKYVEIAHRVKKIGFECHVNAEEAMVWLEENQPELAARIKEAADGE